MNMIGVIAMADDKLLPRYDVSLIRRFEPGTSETLTRATLRQHGYELYFTRGLRAVRVRDKHDNYKQYTWTELEKLVDTLRLKAGLEPIFSVRKRNASRATRRTLTRPAIELEKIP